MAHRGYHQDGLRPSRSQKLETISTLHSTSSPQTAAWGAALDHVARCGNVCDLTTVFCTELNARTNANVRLGGRVVGKPKQVFVANSSCSGKPTYGLILSECSPNAIETATCDILGDDADDDITLNEEEILAWKYIQKRRLLKGSNNSWIGDDSSIDFDDFTLGSLTTRDASTIATMTTKGSDSRVSLQRLRKAHTLDSDGGGDSKSQVSSVKKGSPRGVDDTLQVVAETKHDVEESSQAEMKGEISVLEESKGEINDSQRVLEQDGLAFAAAYNATVINQSEEAKESTAAADIIAEEKSEDFFSSSTKDNAKNSDDKKSD
ncbi:MAG: hypothetical protein SGILL_010765, partial [Bacillariaceae sp.]